MDLWETRGPSLAVGVTPNAGGTMQAMSSLGIDVPDSEMEVEKVGMWSLFREDICRVMKLTKMTHEKIRDTRQLL